MPDDLASNYDAGVFHHSPALALDGKLLFFNGLQTKVSRSFGVSGREFLPLPFVQVASPLFCSCRLLATLLQLLGWNWWFDWLVERLCGTVSIFIMAVNQFGRAPYH